MSVSFCFLLFFCCCRIGCSRRCFPLCLPLLLCGGFVVDGDSDDDGIVDNTEAQLTASFVALAGADADRDGIDDNYDTIVGFGGAGLTPQNSDGSGNPDYTDLNSDYDAELDSVEAHDTNGDGVVDASDVPNAGGGIFVGVDVDVPGVFLLCLTFFLVTHHEHCLLLQDTSRPMLAKQLLDKALENLLQVCRPCSLLTSTSRPLPHCRVPLYPGVSLCMCCPGCETRQRYGRDDHCRGESV